MTFETFIARRYLSSRRKPFFHSFLLFINILGVATGVFALIFVLAVMNGFERDFQGRVLGFKAPLVVLRRDGRDLTDFIGEIQKVDRRIRRVVPFAEGEAIVQSTSGGALGLRVRGIGEPPSEKRLGKIYETEKFSEKSLLLGEELALSLKVHPDFFEDIRLIFPIGDVGPTGDLVPRVRTLSLTGMFRTGFYEYDSKFAVVSYGEALRLFGPEARTGLEVWVEPVSAVEEVKAGIQKIFPGETVQSWRDQSPKLFAAMRLEKIGMFLLLAALLLIASFNIFGLTSLTVLDKIHDMAVLRSMGLRRRRVRRIFLMKAAGIGIFGAIAGGVVGLSMVWLLQHYPVRLPTTYYVDFLPIFVEKSEVVLVLFLVPLFSVLSALYPALAASRPAPVEVLRHE